MYNFEEELIVIEDDEEEELAVMEEAEEFVYPSLQEKEVKPSGEIQEVIADEGVYGLSKVTVDRINLQNKSVTPASYQQVITADSEYSGLDSVTINAVDSSIDNNIVSDNIKSGVEILGVIGSLKSLIGTTIDITENGTYTPESPYNAFTKVNVETSGVDINDWINSDIGNGGGTGSAGNWTNCIKKLKPIFSGTSCNYLFAGFRGTEIDFSNFDTSKVTGMQYMFMSCNRLTTLDLSHFNTSKVNSMAGMFYSSSFVNLDLSNFDTSNVTSMADMFMSCNRLTTLDLSNFDTSKVTGMNRMFYDCRNLTTLDLSHFDMSKVINISYMFNSCGNLVNLYGLKNLGQAYLTTSNANYSSYTLNLSSSNLLTHDSLMNVINNLYDILSKGCNTQQLILGTTNLAKLTSEEIAIATNKGWTVS